MTRSELALYGAIAAAAITASSIGPAAAAIEYPWCVQYSGGSSGGGRNCGFVSYGQCMMTARGAGGMCEPNLFYSGATEPQVRPRKRRLSQD